MTLAPRIAAVVLTYNSADDLPDCLASIKAQADVDLTIIVVDNGSKPDARERMEAAFLQAFPKGAVLSTPQKRDAAALFLRNDTNGGYSAGNNIGARLGVAMGCDAILVINPDVRLEAPDCVAQLAGSLATESRTVLVAPKVKTLTGAQENPMSEPRFVEEMLWPVDMVLAGILRRGPRAPVLPDAPGPVTKVSGACFLIRSDFLERIGFFDEGVFLYCEESILMAQVQAAGKQMVLDPRVEVLHAHRSDTKGDPLRRFRAWAKSRAYFHRAHSGYGGAQRVALAVSRGLTLAIVWARRTAKQSLGMARGRAQ